MKKRRLSFLEILRRLHRTQVRFLLFGGLAEILLGTPVQTVDVDVLLRRDEADATRVLKALSQLGFRPVDNAGNQ